MWKCLNFFPFATSYQQISTDFLMKRLLFLAIWACLGLGSIWAQQPEQTPTQISGRILDKDTHEGVMQVTLQLLRQDSTFVGGVISDEEGNFTLPVDSAGQYILTR